MIEKVCDIWTEPATVKCIPTNGYVRKDGLAVMGAGVAKQAAQRFPEMPAILGEELTNYQNHVRVLMVDDGITYMSFPTKTAWWNTSSLALIKRSAKELSILAAKRYVIHGQEDVFLIPRPGCGNGGLDWEDVKPMIEPILTADHFVIVNDH